MPAQINFNVFITKTYIYMYCIYTGNTKMYLLYLYSPIIEIRQTIIYFLKYMHV